MTGSIPGFIDIIMNLNSPALMEDNLIWQAKVAGKRIIFYGDDTWIRLFPKHFVEYDGTSSFFVSDYTEVSHCLGVAIRIYMCTSVHITTDANILLYIYYLLVRCMYFYKKSYIGYF